MFLYEVPRGTLKLITQEKLHHFQLREIFLTKRISTHSSCFTLVQQRDLSISLSHSFFMLYPFGKMWKWKEKREELGVKFNIILNFEG